MVASIETITSFSSERGRSPERGPEDDAHNHDEGPRLGFVVKFPGKST